MELVIMLVIVLFILVLAISHYLYPEQKNNTAGVKPEDKKGTGCGPFFVGAAIGLFIVIAFLLWAYYFLVKG